MLAWLVVACTRAPLEAPRPDADPLAAPLPVDPEVRMGVLPNGLRWFVEENDQPQGRAVLRLAVRAGSVLEDDDQRGLAHFVEHMAFNGTEHFPGHTMVDWLQSIGSQFGPHVNAHTSFDETVYKLQIPTDDPAAVDQAFQVLDDWAHGLTFDPAEVEAERPVVLEEWRTRLGAQGRIDDATTPALFFGSAYADRRPIGTEESLRTFDPAAAARFYRDWYRPELMAIIAVGDFDPAEIEAKIARQFGDLERPEKPRERVQFEIPSHPDTKYAVVADPEVTRTAVQVLAKRDDVEGNTHRDYRDSLLQNVGFQVVNERLADRARDPEAPFVAAGAGSQRLSPTEGADVLAAGAKPGQAGATYADLLLEIRRIREQGIGEAELARAVARIAKSYETLLLEVENTDSAEHAAELLRVFTNGEAMPGTAYEVELARRYLPELTVADLTAWARDWMASSRVVLVIQPSSDPAPTAADLAAIEARVAEAELPPPQDEVAAGPLVPTPAEPGSIVATDTRYAEALGFTGWTLSNGVKVWWKRTDFKADEVQFQAFSPGGGSRVADADARSAELMGLVAMNSGLGAHDSGGFERWLAGKALGVSPSLAESWDLLGGRSSSVDLESALQVVHAFATAPRFDDDGLALALEKQRAAIANRTNDPQTRFHDVYQQLVWRSDPRRQPWTLADLDQVSLDRVQAVFRDRFGDQGDFTYVFVGALPEDFERMVTTWLGTLPATGRADPAADRGVRWTTGKLEEVVRGGRDPQGRVRLEWRGAFPENTWDTRNRLYALGDVLETLLRERIREDLGGTYGVGVAAIEELLPESRYLVRVEFGCDPARVDELVAAVEAVVEEVRTAGPPAEVVAQVRETQRRAREQQLESNGFWASAFSGALERGADPLEILTFDQRNAALTPESMREAARSWLVDDHRVRLVLLPESEQAKE